MANGFISNFKAFRVRASAFATQVFNVPTRNGDAAVDLYGNLWTRETSVTPGTNPGEGWTYQAVPAVATAVIRNVGQPNSVLTQFGGFNDSAGNIYVQLHNTGAAIAGAAAPVMTFFVPMNASFAWTPSRGGRLFTAGIAFGVSSTKDTYTALATNIFVFAEGIVG